MPQWDPTQYLRFSDERGRPFVDLVARVQSSAATVVDLGCGPGQLMPVLRERWPDAAIVGVDSSAEMIDRAESQEQDPQISYDLADVVGYRPSGPVDVIVSNALFQWVPEQLEVLTALAGQVNPGGAVAVQVPDNGTSPSHALLREIAAQEPYAAHTQGLLEVRGSGPEVYLELFSQLGWTVDAWSTTYLHVLPGDDAVFEWISGTGARPVLQSLPDDLRERFTEEYKAALREAYPKQELGTVLPFRRTFAVAHRPALPDL